MNPFFATKYVLLGVRNYGKIDRVSRRDNEDGRSVDIYGLPSIPNFIYSAKPLPHPPKKPESLYQTMTSRKLSILHNCSAKTDFGHGFTRGLPVQPTIQHVSSAPSLPRLSHPALYNETTHPTSCGDTMTAFSLSPPPPGVFINS